MRQDAQPIRGHVLLTPLVGKGAPDEDGGIRIAVSHETLEAANWLEPYGIDQAFILSGSERIGTLQPGRAYRLEVDLGPRPPAGASIWLTWVQ